VSQVEPEFIKPGKPTQNSYVERFNRTYRDEILMTYVFMTLAELREMTDPRYGNTTKNDRMMHLMA